MQHLDEGILHELLDGEIPSSDLPPIQAHLAACPECRVRLEEARAFAGEADRLIETIELNEEPPVRGAVPLRPAPKRWGRDLAWAATVVIAVGAGYLARGSARPASLAFEDSAAPAPVAAPVSAAPAEAERSAQPPADGAAGAGRRADAPADFARERTRSNAPGRRQEPAAKATVAAATANEAKDSDARRAKVVEPAPTLQEIVTTSVADKAPPQAAKTAAREPARPAPATPAAVGGASLGALRLQAQAANEVRLDELGKVSYAPKREAAPVEISLSDAINRLGGTLRLIEGLVPVRLEALDTLVRVVYPLSPGELVLEQWLADRRVRYRLLAPAVFPADSLERLRARVRD